MKDTLLHFANGRFDQSYDLKILRLAFLTQDLLRLEHHRPDLLRAFRRRFHRTNSLGHFLGVRFELKMASSLVRHGHTFTLRESPDFEITTSGENVYLECGSARLSQIKRGDLFYKIRQELSDKGKKPYANNRTALAIDMSNLMFYGLGMTHPTAMQELRPKVAEVVDETKFGGVLLYAYMLNRATARLEHNYLRIDATRVTAELSLFLDSVAPLGLIHVERPLVAQEG